MDSSSTYRIPPARLKRVGSTLLLWLLWVMVSHRGSAARQLYCDFNRLCMCQNYTAQYIDVTCVNAPLDEMPDPSGYHHLYRMRLIGVRELTQLQADQFLNLITLASLTITKSRLSYVNPDAFRKTPIRHTLTTVDLSHGNLVEVPSSALSHLHQLQWLSLKGNQIELIKSKDLAVLARLKTLILNENSLSILEDQTFQKLSNLELIDFDGNMIERVEGNPFPSSLHTLSLANCLLRKIPFEAISNLAALQVLQLQGNLISHLSPFKLPNSHMRLIDLSHNLISHLPTDLFLNFNQTNLHSFVVQISNSSKSLLKTNKSITESKQIWGEQLDPFHTVTIQTLRIDFNFIQSLPAHLFQQVLIEKLTLSSNRISSALIVESAFDGPLTKSLKVLDLSYNLIDNFPSALKSLHALQQLLLKNNRIKQIDSDAFHNCARTLEVLDLSQNLIEQIPKQALNVLKNLIKINLHDNIISSISDDDLSGWCQQLRSFSVSPRLLTVAPHAFRACKELKELRLGGNQLLHFSPHWLAPKLAKLQLFDLSSLKHVSWLSEHTTFTTGDDKSWAPLPQVKWLQFNFNSLQTIPNQLIKLFPSLMYLDLQNNNINRLPEHLDAIKNLTTIILSHNNLSHISSGMFRNLSKVESIALYFNRLQKIDKFAFQNLPRLQSLVLSANQITQIDSNAFYNLSTESNSLTLLLDQNRLSCLDEASFRPFVGNTRSTPDEFSLYLNASHNQIKTFANCLNSGSSKINKRGAKRRNQLVQTLPVRVLDLSYNQIVRLTVDFLRPFCSEAHSLFVNHNLIRSLPISLLRVCVHLHTLSLNNNQIESEQDGATSFDPMSSTVMAAVGHQSPLQVLSLRHNSIHQLSHFAQFFSQLSYLRSLDLSNNQIKEIPTNFFNKTLLVKLNLAHNQLSMSDQSDQCFGIESTLKYLDISYNSLTLLPNRVLKCRNLIELLASNNQIHSINYITPLHRSLSHLQRLDLFKNPLNSDNQRIRFMFVNNHSMLSSLNLNNLGISQMDELNVPYLHTLDLSDNRISSINSKMVARSRNIRSFNLANNRLQEVPKHIWKYVTRLRHLNLQNNPIDILDSSSFAGLKYLKYLDIRGLKLQYADSRIFLYQSQMSTLKISTYPQIRSFRLQDILAKSDALKTVVVEVQESILSHQIQWAFGGKLRELIITGKNLVQIVPDAFQGLNNANDLILRITNTSVQHLPDGLLKYLADIRYITIDLKNNRLETVSPAVFFNRVSPTDSIKSWQSRQLLGGIILEDNPLRCDCNILWISKWMRETFSEMKSINVEAAIHVKATLSLSRCDLGWRGQTNSGNESQQERRAPMSMAIVDLEWHDLGDQCPPTVTSPAMPLSLHLFAATLHIIVLVIFAPC